MSKALIELKADVVETLRLKLMESSMLNQMINIRAQQVNKGIITQDVAADSI